MIFLALLPSNMKYKSEEYTEFSEKEIEFTKCFQLKMEIYNHRAMRWAGEHHGLLTLKILGNSIL